MVTYPLQFAEFALWVRNYMKIPTSALPDDSPYLEWAFLSAKEWIPHCYFQCMPMLYREAVFNMGGSLIIQYANDIPGNTYFEDLRKKFGVGGMTSGVMSSAADQGTSGSMEISDAMKNLSLADLQAMQDPYGRRAIAILQELGPVWGLT